jgi:hypothetical protein
MDMPEPAPDYSNAPLTPMTVPPAHVAAADGTGDTSQLTAFAFSQGNEGGAADPNVLAINPDINLRTWQRWDTYGRLPTDFSAAQIASYKSQNIALIGGTTATVLFADETDPTTFADWVTRDATDAIVAHNEIVPGAHRGSIANPDYRAYILSLAKVQIDLGVTGLFFDEADAGYQGPTYNGDEGFDDDNLRDFKAFLCGKYASLTPSAFAAKFPIGAAGPLDCNDNAQLRDYLQQAGFGGFQSVFWADWGSEVANRPDLASGLFTRVVPAAVYWANVVAQVRAYARTTYNREVLITSNGVFPYVDFQSVGLYDYNQDGAGGADVNYVPTTSANHVDASQSLVTAYRNLRARSLTVAGRDVPVAMFMDWPTASMNRYLALNAAEKANFYRLFGAEAFAAGTFLAMFLADTVGDPTASQQGTVPFFTAWTTFVKANARLFHGFADSASTATIAASNVVSTVRTQGSETLVHLINHNYTTDFVPQTMFTVQIPLAAAPTTVQFLTPDNPSQNGSFSYANGTLTVTIFNLTSWQMIDIQ